MNRPPQRFRSPPWLHALLLGGLLALSRPRVDAAILLELEGVRGDVSRGTYHEQMACDSLSFGVNRSLEESVKSGTADISLGLGELGFITLKKRLDASSSFLVRKGISGASVGSVRIRCFAEPARRREAPYLLIDVDTAFIKSWAIAGTAGELPSEEIQIYYNKISIQNARTIDGTSPQVNSPATWDLVQSKPWTGNLLLEGFQNLSPVVVADAISRPAGSPVKIPVSALTGNDTDPEGDAFSVFGVTGSGAPGAKVSLSGNWIYYAATGDAPDYFDYTVEDEYGATATGRVDVTVTGTPTEQKLELAGVMEHVPGKAEVFRLSFNGIPGLRYRILFSDEVAPPVWELLGYANAADNGLVNYVDEAGKSGRLYRVVYP